MKKTVLILMSTYNGGESIERQIDSIICQKGVDVSVSIRDDGSFEDTKSILKRICDKYDGKVTVQFGSNIGWKASFMELIHHSLSGYDYYGFSDQDDVWMEDKLINCVTLMENDGDVKCVKLAHCNSLSVDANMHPRKKQEYIIPSPLNYKTAISTECFQGCGMIWNGTAMELLKHYRTRNEALAHDYWVGIVCYLCGKVYYCDKRLFYHVRHDSNSSQDGKVWSGRLQRLSLFSSDVSVYMNPSEDLLMGFSQYLDNDQTDFLRRLIDYKENIKSKIQLLVDRDFRRPTLISTFAFKIAIIMNKI